MEKKSIAALIVTGAMVFGLSACGTNGATSDNADNSQSTSTPTVTEPVDTSSQTKEVEETTPDTAETTPVSQEETQQETQPTAQSQEENPVSKEVGPKFTEVNETVYATTSVNVRASYSADSDKVGSLAAGASATRTGVGDNGWSRIVYGDSVAYVSSDYLTTTKPSTNTGSAQTSKPSTGSSSSSGGTSSGGTQGGGSTMTPEEYQEWMKQWGGGTVSAEESVDPNDPGYRDWLTGQLNGGSTGQQSTTSNSQSGSNQMTPEEFQDWASQWGGTGTSNENRVDPNDPGYQDWLTGQLNGG